MCFRKKEQSVLLHRSTKCCKQTPAISVINVRRCSLWFDGKVVQNDVEISQNSKSGAKISDHGHARWLKMAPLNSLQLVQYIAFLYRYKR